MKIRQILNNNVVLVQDEKKEIIVLSKGIVFRKKVGDELTDNDIDKKFILDSDDTLKKFRYLLENTKEEYVIVINKIIEYAEKELAVKANDYLYLTLLDHINFSIQRIDKNITFRNPLHWEVKKFYPVQYTIGLNALKILKDELNVVFPENEAVAIALHFINLQSNKNNYEDTIKIMTTIEDILTIVKYHFKIIFNEESISYSRFITHLQFFAQRIVSGEFQQEDIMDAEIHMQVKKMYTDAYLCVKKIGIYIQKKYNINLLSDEETYLIIHIQRVTNRD